MTTLGERLIKAREKKQLTQQQLAELIGVTQQLIHKIERNEVKKTSFIIPLARVLEVSPDWLQYGKELQNIENNPLDFIPSQRKVVPLLNWDDAQKWLQVRILPPKVRMIEMFLEERISEQAFLMRARGDAMESPEPTPDSIYEGDKILIDPGLEPVSSDLVLVQINSDLYLRQFKQDGSTRYLRAFNPKADYPRVNLQETDDNIKILGVLTHIYRTRRRPG